MRTRRRRYTLRGIRQHGNSHLERGDQSRCHYRCRRNYRAAASLTGSNQPAGDITRRGLRNTRLPALRQALNGRVRACGHRGRAARREGRASSGRGDVAIFRSMNHGEEAGQAEPRRQLEHLRHVQHGNRGRNTKRTEKGQMVGEEP